MAFEDNLTIIDGKSVFYRGYYAMGHLSLPDGTPTGGVYGFASMLIEIIEKLQPEYVAVAWDKSKTNIRSRRAIYPDYKANRKPAPPDFYQQIPLLMDLLKAFHIPLYEFDDYEADDIIGTLARSAQDQGVRVEIISGDLDMLQIVDEHIKMYQLKRGFSDVVAFDIPAVEAKYGLAKEQFLDLKAIKGDSSDNIPGVPGIGEKGAVKLLQSYGTLENVFQHLDEITGSTQQKLQSGQKLAEISKQLASIKFDAPVKFDPVHSKLADFQPDAVVAELQKLHFNSLLRKFHRLFGQTETSTKQTPATKSAPAPTPSKSSEKITIPDRLYLSQQVKTDMHDDPKLAEEILAGRPFWDLDQVDFLLSPLTHDSKQLNLLDSADYPARYVAQRERLARLPNIANIAENFDLPLIPVLYKMERTGIAIDPKRFKLLEREFSAELSKIEQEIYSFVKHEFNLNSPLQLSEVLFNELQLPTHGIKKNTRAYSTGAKELSKLRNAHPIIGKIERYRVVSKLLSTYVRPLPALADADQRIHSTFTQNVTATGRLSSLNPNLQNIPVRSADGKRIRDCFVAKPGHVFVSADYAQFELRLASALANDEALIEDFNNDLDIHTKTASDAFHVPMSKVTKEQRRIAKTINFGVLYGMSAKGLSDATGMSLSEASAFIKRYFELRAPIRQYIDQTLQNGRKYGYVETYYGRWRPTPDLSAQNRVVRASAERMASNMPIQGTEADLMKRAMLAVDQALPPEAKLVLQIHDSLMVECPSKQAKQVSTILQQAMEGVAPELPVKLAVDISTGKNWGEL